jgi:broad specificity phosphatase PhoE
MSRILVLVKHATPVLDAAVPAKEWRLGDAGEAESVLLAERLRRFAPFRLVTSPEPKALRTCEIVAAHFDLPLRTNDGLREIDRRAMPIMSADEHRRVNADIFADSERAVLGAESARAALARFSSAIHAELAGDAAGNVVAVTHGNVVAVTHGTVIALFAAAHNQLDPFRLWTTLACTSVVVLELPSFRLSAAPDSSHTDPTGP